LLWQTREQAIQAPRGDIRLGFCRDCSHIYNLAFKPELMSYTQAYENSIHFSPHFQSYAKSLAAQLIDRYDLHGKDIIEIGCGKGDFLRLLCELGGNRGMGFDPGYAPEQNGWGTTTEAITFIQDFYSEKYANYEVDFICCRHVLEHIQFPRDFLNSVRHSIGNRLKTVVFFEVPNVLFTLRDMGIWDLIYEHCSYFSSSSLSCLFTSCGFEVCDLNETYEGQFLHVEALSGEGSEKYRVISRNDLGELTSDVAVFADKYRRKVKAWQGNLERTARMGQRVVVWGGGSKGVTFLNTLKIYDQIEYVVDINPRKQGRYIAGTGQQIMPPEFLRDYQPDVVIIMNPIYQSEIQQITDKLGLTNDFISV
ncbi:MAG: methyltransferase domain-containing protein, partial [Candidatus Hodarchaeota archaeon]